MCVLDPISDQTPADIRPSTGGSFRKTHRKQRICRTNSEFPTDRHVAFEATTNQWSRSLQDRERYRSRFNRKASYAASPRKTLWTIYVGAGQEQTVPGIPPGKYLLRFGLGKDWNDDARTFLQKKSFYQAGTQFTFTEVELAENKGTQFVEHHVTLNEVLGGTVLREEITEAAFNDSLAEQGGP